ncbi:MAG TPA: hypothetical protein VFC10_02200 [Terriglobia bacterium]|nr:hypothetical protein [Terriglobia bacterium]
MKTTEIDLRDYVNGIASELTGKIEHQREVLLKFIEDCENDGRQIDYCPLIKCGPRQKYRAAVLDAIQVIEETRRSFKSRQLEDLRKRLENLVAEDAAGKL